MILIPLSKKSKTNSDETYKILTFNNFKCLIFRQRVRWVEYLSWTLLQDLGIQSSQLCHKYFFFQTISVHYVLYILFYYHKKYKYRHNVCIPYPNDNLIELGISHYSMHIYYVTKAMKLLIRTYIHWDIFNVLLYINILTIQRNNILFYKIML